MSSPPKLKNMFYESSAIVKTIVWPWEDILNLYIVQLMGKTILNHPLQNPYSIFNETF
jgi:hypothetical protein